MSDEEGGDGGENEASKNVAKVEEGGKTLAGNGDKKKKATVPRKIGPDQRRRETGRVFMVAATTAFLFDHLPPSVPLVVVAVFFVLTDVTRDLVRSQYESHE